MKRKKERKGGHVAGRQAGVMKPYKFEINNTFGMKRKRERKGGHKAGRHAGVMTPYKFEIKRNGGWRVGFGVSGFLLRERGRTGAEHAAICPRLDQGRGLFRGFPL